ncbi:MAG: bifunctional chorismate mutase/prephenate dehydratase [Coriobacteriaceae bacterium]|nr:bifunctional chorismate mutase/prephenate dehydratase [Coriobacteriaceae bacterium]
MDLAEIRERLDGIDGELIRLVNERLDLAAEVAAAKRRDGRAVFDPAREREKIHRAATAAGASRAPQAIALMSLLMSMNRAEQQRILAADDEGGAAASMRGALLPADACFPAAATVACQGTEGSFSQHAAARLFRAPSITYLTSFEGVFRAVADGLCEYGVLPIENSTAGSVNAVYDLLGSYGFSIVRSLRLKVEHSLLALPGATVAGLREVISHEQALAQCAGRLNQLGVETRAVKNTAIAAELVAASGRCDLAALASTDCAALYGLEPLEEGVQDSEGNYTRFVVVSASPQIFPGATRTSLMLALKHEPGSLYRVLERLFALDINLVKLESRPIAGRDFEFAFYFDLDCPVGSPALDTLLDALGDVCERFTYFGSYQEIV